MTLRRLTFTRPNHIALTLTFASALALATLADAATKTWDGGAGTTSWHDGDNWQPNGVPGARDDVVLTGAITVVHSAGATPINSLSLTTGTLVVEGGTLDVFNLFDVIGGTLQYTGGVIDGAPRVRNGGSLLIGPAATAPVDFVVNGGATFAGTINAGQSVWVQGSNLAGSASLTLLDGSANAGTLRVESIGSTWGSSISIPAGTEFVNLPGGILQFNLGAGGARDITGAGDLRNHGTIAVTPSVGVTMSGVGRTLHQVDGAIETDGGFTISSGTLRIDGGSVGGAGVNLVTGGSLVFDDGITSGEFLVRNSSIDVRSTVTSDSVVVAESACTLVDQASASTTLWVRGSSAASTATLTTSRGTTNAGRIRVESINATWPSQLAVPADQEFVNLPGAVIDFNLGAGGPRAIAGMGHIRNEGTITIEPGVAVTMAGVGRMLRQVDGEIANDGTFTMTNTLISIDGGTVGGNGTTVLSGGVLDFSGGTVDGTLIAFNSSIDVHATVASASTVIAAGSCTLVDQASVSTTLWVRGSSSTATATLTTSTGTTNAGRIRVESINATWASQLAVPAGEEFVNLSGALIDFNLGAGGPRAIAGSGHFRNEGTVAIESGVALTMSGTGRTLRQVSGALDTDGTFTMSNTSLVIEGGSVDGTGTVLLSAGDLDFSGGTIDGTLVARTSSIAVHPTVTSQSTIIAEGTCALSQQSSPTTTIWVRGSSAGSTGLLNVAPGLANAGAILLESIQSTWVSQIGMQAGSTFTNLATGVIRARAGTGGARSITGANTQVINHGLIDPGFPNHLSIAGSYTQSATGTLFTEYAGPALTQHARLNVTGTATLSGGLELVRVNGYLPAPATVHTFLNSGARTGVFDTVTTCDDVTVTYNATQAAVQFSVSGVLGDLNGDSVVNGADLGLLLNAWGSASCGADLNGDGVVNGADLGLLLNSWG